MKAVKIVTTETSDATRTVHAVMNIGGTLGHVCSSCNKLSGDCDKGSRDCYRCSAGRNTPSACCEKLKRDRNNPFFPCHDHQSWRDDVSSCCAIPVFLCNGVRRGGDTFSPPRAKSIRELQGGKSRGHVDPRPADSRGNPNSSLSRRKPARRGSRSASGARGGRSGCRGEGRSVRWAGRRRESPRWERTPFAARILTRALPRPRSPLRRSSTPRPSASGKISSTSIGGVPTRLLGVDDGLEDHLCGRLVAHQWLLRPRIRCSQGSLG